MGKIEPQGVNFREKEASQRGETDAQIIPRAPPGGYVLPESNASLRSSIPSTLPS